MGHLPHRLFLLLRIENRPVRRSNVSSQSKSIKMKNDTRSTIVGNAFWRPPSPSAAGKKNEIGRSKFFLKKPDDPELVLSGIQLFKTANSKRHQKTTKQNQTKCFKTKYKYVKRQIAMGNLPELGWFVGPKYKKVFMINIKYSTKLDASTFLVVFLTIVRKLKSSNRSSKESNKRVGKKVGIIS